MSFHAAYVVSDSGPPKDGDHLASGKGWLSWGDWFIDRADEFPACAHLAEEGWLEASSFGPLAEELGEALKDQGEPIVNITRQLREALDDMPAGCKGLIVTDGTADD